MNATIWWRADENQCNGGQVKFNKRPGLSASDVRILSLIGLVALIVVSSLIGANIGLSRSIPGGGEFFAGWAGARSFLSQHIGPYSGTVAIQVQQLVYGRVAQAGENPYLLTTPFFLLPVYFSLALISDPVVARGLWMFFSEAALLATAWLSLRLIEWTPRRPFVIVFFLLSIFSFYSAVSLLEGSPAVVLVLLYFGILRAYYSEQDELTGALLALSLFKWEIGSLFLLLIFWRIFSEKRWRSLIGFGMALIILLGVSFLIYPGGNWIFPMLTVMLAVARSDFGISTAAIFARLWPEYGTRLTQIVTTVTVVVLFYEWYKAHNADFRRFIWVACLTLAATPLIGFRTEMSSLVVLFPGLALIFAAATERWPSGYWLSGFLLLIVFITPWSLFVRGYFFGGIRSQDLLFLFYPIFVIAGLYWTRWWFIRPPRTWLDHVRSIRS